LPASASVATKVAYLPAQQQAKALAEPAAAIDPSWTASQRRRRLLHRSSVQADA
jgi:hypothetical protein